MPLDISKTQQEKQVINSRKFIFTHRRSIAERGGCFQWSPFVCLFVCQHNNFKTIKRTVTKLGG